MGESLLLADDHVVLREGLKYLLLQEGFDIVAEVSNGREAVMAASALRPAVAMLDIGMPELNGIDAARQIHSSSPATQSMLLTVHKENQFALEAFRAGVKGYVLKTQAAAELVQAVRAVLQGKIYLSPAIAESVVHAALSHGTPELEPLTLREREVLKLIGEGHTNKEISHSLGLSIKTAEAHRGNLMKKLNIHQTAGLVRYAIKIGLIQP